MQLNNKMETSSISKTKISKGTDSSIINKYYIDILIFLLCTTFIGIFYSSNYMFFNIAYIFVFIFMIVKTLLKAAEINAKLIYMIIYIFIMISEIIFNTLITFNPHTIDNAFLFTKLFGITIILVPFVVEKMFFYHRNSNSFMSSFQEFSVVSYAQLMHDKDKIVSAIEKINKAGQALSKDNMVKILSDLPRHNCFRYINDGSLTEEYFKRAYDSLNDNYLYIVVSNTGSAASELISVFTNKMYNHISIAFDKQLLTIISYNGGENVYPPGLNHEMIDFFNKKADSSIIVYKLYTTTQQKKQIIDKVKEINHEGSAYNLLGLVFKYSHKPNIMFCSQFVYKMLQYAGLAYFVKKDIEVKPTDFIELDYYRKLEFVCEVKLNAIKSHNIQSKL